MFSSPRQDFEILISDLSLNWRRQEVSNFVCVYVYDDSFSELIDNDFDDVYLF